MKFKTSFFTASVFIYYLGERKIYQIKKLIHCLIGAVFAVPLCRDFIIPHQYWQLCDENKNVFGIFNFIMCSNKQCIWEFKKFVFKYNFCRYSRKNDVLPYKIVQMVAILRSGINVFHLSNCLHKRKKSTSAHCCARAI